MTVHDHPEKLSNGLSLLMTAAVLLALGMPHLASHVPPPPPPPVQEMIVALEEPPHPPPQIVAPQPPPPPPQRVLENVPTVPILPKQRPQPPQPPMVRPPPPETVATTPPAPAPPPTVAPPPPVSAGIEATFVGQLRAYIKSITRYPMSKEARLLKPQGSVEVGFVLARSGAVQDVTMVRSSGSMVLDHQAVSIVRGGTYPAIPTEAWEGAQTHSFTVTVDFALTE